MFVAGPSNVRHCSIQCPLSFRPMFITVLFNVRCGSVQCPSQVRPMSVTSSSNVRHRSVWCLLPFRLRVYCRSIRHPSSFHSTSIVVPFDVYWRFVRRLFVWFCSSSPFHPLMFIYCRSSPSTHPHSSNHMYVIHTYLISYSSNHMLC